MQGRRIKHWYISSNFLDWEGECSDIDSASTLREVQQSQKNLVEFSAYHYVYGAAHPIGKASFVVS